MAKSEFLKIFKERGFFHQCTDEEALDNLLSSEKITAYIGFDCTATSLHVGSLMQIMVLRWLKKLGHNPIILLGGATTKIGDPSGKDESRPKITDETIAQNMAGIRAVFDQFGLQSAQMVNNDDWFTEFLLNIINLSEYFAVKKMLTFDSVKTRMEREEAPLSLKEFLYMVMQANDFAYLAQKQHCRLQIGGSDQWGNIVNGVDLHKKMLLNSSEKKYSGSNVNVCFDGETPVMISSTGTDNPKEIAADLRNKFPKKSIFGLTTPLITTSSGAKMGKTAAGAVWLSTDIVQPSGTQTSSYDYWQFWRNTEDKDVFKFMRLFTELDIAEIARMEQEMQGAAINQAKIILANEATKICHGEEAAKHAQETAQKVFQQGGIGDDLPTVEISKAELEAGIPAFKILHLASLVESGGEAKNLIKGGGAKINDAKISDIGQIVGLADVNADGLIKLSAGKKKHAIVKLV